MSDHEEESKTTFRVRDRRRFDYEGNERPEEQVSSPAPNPAAVKPEPAPARPAIADSGLADDVEADEAEGAGFTMKASDEEGEGEGIDFSSFIMSLATQALVQLGEMRPPSGMEIPIDREAAQQSIEIIAMLARKTRGNLSAVEAKLVEDILHNLRISYVSALR